MVFYRLQQAGFVLFFINKSVDTFLFQGHWTRPSTEVMPNRNTRHCKDLCMSRKKELPPTLWNIVSSPLKEEARKWFIRRAVVAGIPWEELSNKYREPRNVASLLEWKTQLENLSIVYPEYFLQPFHGYDAGNMNWRAAEEGEAASLTMCANYWKNVCAQDSEQWVRNNITKNVISYLNREHNNCINNDTTNSFDNIITILDVGSSVGISTEYLSRGFPKAERIYGLDLSPYFVAVSSFRANKNKYDITYVHQNAEETQFSEKTFDLIVCNFFFHEVPRDATDRILREMYRILKPNGVLAIVDLDPAVLQDRVALRQFRKWAFEVTEPHIYQYYNGNMSETMQKNNFHNVVKRSNDPVNSIWIGSKHTLYEEPSQNMDNSVDDKRDD